MGKRGPKRGDRGDIWLYRNRVAELKLRGHTDEQIAEIVSSETGSEISRRQISYDLKAVRENWMENSRDTYDKMVNVELARLDALEEEAWAAWRRSLGNKTKDIVDTDDTGERIRQITENSSGKPEFLRIIGDVQSERRKILGLYAPAKMQATVEKRILIKSYSTVSPDDWDDADIIDATVSDAKTKELEDGSE